MAATVESTVQLLGAFSRSAAIAQTGRANRDRTEQLKRSIDVQEKELRHRIQRDSSLSDSVSATNDRLNQRLEHDKNVATQQNTLAIAAQVLEGKRVADREARTQLENRKLDATSVLQGEQFSDLNVELMIKAAETGVLDEPSAKASAETLRASASEKDARAKLAGESGDTQLRNSLMVSSARDLSQAVFVESLVLESQRQKLIQTEAAEGGLIGTGKKAFGAVKSAVSGFFGGEKQDSRGKQFTAPTKKAFGVGASVTEEEKVLQGAFGTGTGGQQSTLQSILGG